MLSLTRRYGEALLIGDDIRIEIRPAQGAETVKVRVDAPRSLPVMREELLSPDQRSTARRTTVLEPANASAAGPKVYYRPRRRAAAPDE
ncbi:carbon storage regulator [Arhodomonas sp. AD133]|uniref:carbon storage regulator n=1 Tax=Arhodomonas sp. AD133 TaxID=3415009 RepID=UPI003EB8D010